MYVLIHGLVRLSCVCKVIPVGCKKNNSDVFLMQRFDKQQIWIWIDHSMMNKKSLNHIKIITQNLKVSFIMLGHRLCYYPYPHGSVTGRDFTPWTINFHYNDVIMCPMASQITGLAIVYSIVHLGADQRKHQSSALLAFVKGIHWRPVNSPHKGPVSRKMFLFDDVIMPVIMT